MLRTVCNLWTLCYVLFMFYNAHNWQSYPSLLSSWKLYYFLLLLMNSAEHSCASNTISIYLFLTLSPCCMKVEFQHYRILLHNSSQSVPSLALLSSPLQDLFFGSLHLMVPKETVQNCSVCISRSWQSLVLLPFSWSLPHLLLILSMLGFCPWIFLRHQKSVLSSFKFTATVLILYYKAKSIFLFVCLFVLSVLPRAHKPLNVAT